MKYEAVSHAKMLMLSEQFRAMSEPESHIHVAIGVVESLLRWARDSAPQGNVGKWDNATIAAGIRWAGDPDKLVAALVKAGWLDEHPKHRLIIHDIKDHAETSWRKRLARMGMKWYDGSDPFGEVGRPVSKRRISGKLKSSVNLPEISRNSTLPDLTKPDLTRPEQNTSPACPVGQRTKPAIDKRASTAWGMWVDVWKASGRTIGPVDDGPELHAAQRLVKHIPNPEEVKRVMVAYLNDDDPWLVDKGHPMRLLMGKINRYRGAEPVGDAAYSAFVNQWRDKAGWRGVIDTKHEQMLRKAWSFAPSVRVEALFKLKNHWHLAELCEAIATEKKLDGGVKRREMQRELEAKLEADKTPEQRAEAEAVAQAAIAEATAALKSPRKSEPKSDVADEAKAARRAAIEAELAKVVVPVIKENA